MQKGQKDCKILCSKEPVKDINRGKKISRKTIRSFFGNGRR